MTITIAKGNTEIKQNYKALRYHDCGEKGNYFEQEICLDKSYDKYPISITGFTTCPK